MMHMGLLGFGLGMSMPVMLVAVVFAIGAVVAGLSVVAAAFSEGGAVANEPRARGGARIKS
jgi:hypothetical protein